MRTLSDREFGLIRNLVYKWFGINLTDQKRALIVGRLNKVLREEGFENFEQYYDYVINDESGKALGVLVDRISTNHTFFNRENDHFQYFQNDVLPEWLDRLEAKRQRKFRLWVAGCSSGEESYMLAMILHDVLGSELAKWDVGILATDISVTALEKAVKGIYVPDNIKHLPQKLRNSYFSKLPDGNYQVKDKLKTMVTYRKLNLMRSDFPFKGRFQVVFCRNVMIYFDKPTRDALVSRFHRYMEPEGYLFIGHSETLGRNNELFRYLRPAVYRREGSA